MNLTRYKMSYSPDLYHGKLQNGLDLIVVPDHRLPLAHLGAVVQTGAISETPETNGLAHLYEHMFFKANQDHPSKQAFENREKELGIKSNASTAAEVVRYFFSLPSDRLEEGTSFLASALLRPLFNEEELEKERSVILDEYDRAMSKPERRLYRQVRERLFSKYPWRRNVLGQRDVIENATRSQMKHFQETCYHPDNTALVAIGDTSPDTVQQYVQDHFSSWESRKNDDTEDRPLHPSLEESSAVVETGDVDFVKLQVRWHGPNVQTNPQQTIVADVWGTMVELASSRFRTRLVDEGPFRSISFGYYTQKDGPSISFLGTLPPEKFEEGYRLMQSELSRFSEPGYFRDEERKNAIQNLRIDRKFSVENGRRYLQVLGFWWAIAGLDYFRTYLQNISEVTLEDIRSYCSQYLLNQERVIGALLPEDARFSSDLSPDWLLNHWSLDQNQDELPEDRNISDASTTVQSPTADEQPVDPETTTGSSGEDRSRTADAARSENSEQQLPSDVPEGTFSFTLENGIPVIFRKNTANQIVSLQSFFNGGVVRADDDPAGIEQFVLNAMQRGTEHFPLEALKKFLDQNGMSINSSSNYDYSRISLQFLQDRFSKASHLLEELLINPLFQQEQIDWVRKQMISRLRQRKANPNRRMWFVANEALFSNHPYRNYPEGRVESLKEIDRSTVRNYHEDLLETSDMLISVTGNLSLKTLKERLEEVFSSIDQRWQSPVNVPGFELDRNKVNVESLDQSRTAYVVGKFPLPSMNQEDHPVLEVGLKILSERIFDELRNRRGLTYGAYSGQAFYRRNWGYFYVTTARPNKAVSLIHDEIQNMKEEPVEETERTQAINILRTNKLLKRQSASVQAERLGRLELTGPGWEQSETMMDRLKNVTAGEIQEAFKKHIRNFAYGILRDPESDVPEIDEEHFQNFQ